MDFQFTGRRTEGTERHITEDSKELLWLPLSNCILFLGNVDLIPSVCVLLYVSRSGKAKTSL